MACVLGSTASSDHIQAVICPRRLNCCHTFLTMWKPIMKKIMPIVALLLVSIAPIQGAAAADASLEKRMD